MNVTVDNNGFTKVTVDEPELDIYSAIALKERLHKLLEEGMNGVHLDLSRTTSLSTPAVQVIISASKSFENFRIEKESLQPSLIEDLRSIGINL